MRTMCVLLLVVGAVLASDVKRRVWDFEDATVGRMPQGWTAAKTGLGEGSVWKVVEDTAAPNGPKVIAQTAESPNAMFNVCVIDDSSLTDVEASVAFKANKGKTDQGGGIVWRYADANNYYIARYNPLENNYRLYKVVAGKRIQLATREELEAPTDKWHALTVKMTGNQIECHLNGKKQLEKKDDTFIKAGKVGLWTKADAQTSFDEFTIGEASK